jgi:amino acid permease
MESVLSMELDRADQSQLLTHKEDEEEADKASDFAITANLVTGGLGAGILSLPWTAAGASILTAALITGFALALNAWTIMILVEAAEKYDVFDIGAVLSMLSGKLGHTSQAVCNLLVWGTMFMCLVGYLIIIADSVEPLTAGTALGNREIWIAFGSLAVLPLCFLDQQYLSFSSTLSILVNVYLVLLVAYLSVTQPWHGLPQPCVFGLGEGCVSMCSALMMAIVIQMCVLPMYQSMRNRSVARFRRVLTVSFSFLFVLFVGFQTLALVAFGPFVQSNVLRNLPDDFAGSLARLGMIGAVLGVYPIMIAPMVAPVRSAKGNGLANWATLAIVLGAMGVGFFVRDLGIMNVLNGAISVAGFVAVAPGLVGFYLLGKSRWAMALLILTGLLLGALGLVLTGNYVENADESCLVKMH